MELFRFDLIDGRCCVLSGDYTKIPESFKAEEIEHGEDFANFLKDIYENSEFG